MSGWIRKAWMGLVVVLTMLCASSAHALSIQQMTYLRGTGETTLWGLGFVVGLPGTGDKGESLPMARQLAALLERGGNVVPSLEELADAQNIAMVMVTCTIPREGARKSDTFDVHVQAWHEASSLEGGRLFITPLTGPLPGQGVYSFAEGPVILDGTTPTVGRVRGGARMSRDIEMNVIDQTGTISLNIRPEYAGWTTAKLLANTINQDRQGFRETTTEIARAVDARTVTVAIPEPELADPANFIGNVLSIRLDASLLELPARVIVNERTGSIVLTGDVQISPAVIAHENLVVTTVTPPLEPTPDTPAVRRSNVTALGRPEGERPAARLSDLLEAMKALDVPVADQIAILAKMHEIGHLHAEFIIE
ncbi:MAG: flagellar basal body P-ring protein FlgI [Planctomycetota bacterium]